MWTECTDCGASTLFSPSRHLSHQSRPVIMAIVDPPPDRAHHDARLLAAVIALASSSAQLTAKYNEIQMNSDKLYCVIQKHDATCDLNSPNEDAL